ncbi:MAG: hypothetical protein ACKV0T_17275 [Planctomycetales bacterium]
MAEPTLHRFEYCDGFPGRFRRDRRETLRWSLGCLGPFLLASLIGGAASTFAYWSHAAPGDLFRTLALGAFVCYFAFLIWRAVAVASETAIVPYFQRPLGGIVTFSGGHRVARSCRRLDELAAQRGLTPLSAYGFNDDLQGEPLNWHPPEQGLATFDGLLAGIYEVADSDVDKRLVEELTAMRDALEKAVVQRVPFCLLLRVGDSTNAQEWELRQGSCF